MKTEDWLDVPGYEGRYQVSTLGRARSLARVDDGGHARRSRLLRPLTNSSGRLYYRLTKHGEGRTYCASVLLARAYGLPNPGAREYVIHENGDNRDFRRGNLRWATFAELRMHDGHKTSSPYLGVIRRPGNNGYLPWEVVLNVDGRRHFLGCFATPEEAAYVYDGEVRRRGLARPVNGVRRPWTDKSRIPSLPGETWRPFPDAEGTHMISNKGRVRTRAYVAGDGRRVMPKLRTVTVTANGHRSILIAEKRRNMRAAMARAFPGKRDTAEGKAGR